MKENQNSNENWLRNCNYWYYVGRKKNNFQTLQKSENLVKFRELYIPLVGFRGPFWTV